MKNSTANKTLNLLLDFSNINGQKYDLKEYHTSQSGSFETIHGDRNYVTFGGSVWIIAKKEVLDKINEWEKRIEIIEPEGFKYGITKFIENGYSMAVMTDYVYDWSILPDDYKVKNANIIKISINNEYSDLCCYTHNDELEKAIDIINKEQREKGKLLTLKEVKKTMRYQLSLL